MSRAVCVVCLLIAQCLTVGCATEDDPRPTFPVADACYRWGPSMIFFETGRADLNSVAIAQLDRLVKAWHVDGGKFRVDGHADAAGSASANRALAKARADQAREYLLKAGVPTGSILVSSRGDQQPLVQVSTSEAQNRRVEILHTAERSSCAEELRKPFDAWYARNCKPTPKPGRGDDCKSVKESFPQ